MLYVITELSFAGQPGHLERCQHEALLSFNDETWCAFEILQCYAQANPGGRFVERMRAGLKPSQCVLTYFEKQRAQCGFSMPCGASSLRFDDLHALTCGVRAMDIL